MFHFKKGYLLAAIILFLIEVFIGLYVRDNFIRPYGGDFLVVMLIYCSLRAVVNQPPWRIAVFTLVFSFLVEIGQYFKVVEMIGLKGNRLAETIIGTGYSNHDLLAYTLGVAVVYFLDVRFFIRR